MTALVRSDAGAVALFEPAAPRLDRTAFAVGLAMVAASERREVTPELTAAFWLALADVRTDDFGEGLRRALGAEKFLSPAAVRSHVEAARYARLEDEAAAAQAEERRREEEEFRRREARRVELRALVAGWTAPPATAAEVLARMLALGELERPALGSVLAGAVAGGTVDRLELRGLASQFRAFIEMHPEELARLASRAAGRPVDVALTFAEVAS